MIKIGDFCYFSAPIDYTKYFTSVLYSDDNEVTIGNFCSFGDSVTIFAGGEHNIDWVTTYPLSENFKMGKMPGHPTSKGPVVIGNDVWVGSKATILSGVTIGDGAVVGAGAVVASDIPAYAIASGNPAKVIRKRFEEHIIMQLLDIKWWYWPIDKIKEAVPLLQSDNIWEFIKYARSIISSDAVFQEQVPAGERVYDS